jgi:hypothetical protein
MRYVLHRGFDLHSVELLLTSWRNGSQFMAASATVRNTPDQRCVQTDSSLCRSARISRHYRCPHLGSRQGGRRHHSIEASRRPVEGAHQAEAPTANRLLKSRSPSSRSLKLSGGGQATLWFSTGQICTSFLSHGPDLIRSRRLPCIALGLRFTDKTCMTSLPMTNVVAHPSSSGFVAVGFETWSFLASPWRLLL